MGKLIYCLNVSLDGFIATLDGSLDWGAIDDELHTWFNDQSRTMDFWRRMDEETERRRRVVTPPYVAARIMASLPETASRTVVAPWWKKDVQLSPGAVIALAVSAFVLGLLAMRLVTA